MLKASSRLSDPFHSRHLKVVKIVITLTIALLYSSVPESNDSLTVSQHEQHQDPETKQLNVIQPSVVLSAPVTN